MKCTWVYYLGNEKFMDNTTLTVMYNDFVWRNRVGLGATVYCNRRLELWHCFTAIPWNVDVVFGKWLPGESWFSVNQYAGVTWSLKVHEYFFSLFLCCNHSIFWARLDFITIIFKEAKNIKFKFKCITARKKKREKNSNRQPIFWTNKTVERAPFWHKLSNQCNKLQINQECENIRQNKEHEIRSKTQTGNEYQNCIR